MALILKKYTGGAVEQLSAVLGTGKKQFRQFSMFADSGNGAGGVYVGPSTVTNAPANEVLSLAAGVSLNLSPQLAERPFVVDTDELYVVGANAGDILWLQAVTDDAR